MDELCKEHDIAYTKTTDRKERNKADKKLANKAWQRAKSSKAKLSERVASAAVAAVMAAKSKLGMGLKRKKKRSISQKRKSIQRKKQRGSGIRDKSKKKKTNKKKKKKFSISPSQQKIVVKKLYNQAVSHTKHVIAAKKPKPLKNAVIMARNAAQKIIKKNKTLSKKEIKNNLPRIIPIPKQQGGAISVFGALSALGAIMGGTSGIVNAIRSAKTARKLFEESKRHNETMEAIAIGKKPKNGSGLFLGPHPRKNGLGLFLNTAVNNSNDDVPKN